MSDTNTGEGTALARMRPLEERLWEQPIALPPHPYRAALEDFGKDEAIAGLIDAGATWGVALALPQEYKPYVLPFTGPVLEKFGFFVRHLHHARKEFRQTPPSMRKTKWEYFKQGVSGGMPNLTKDLLVHDPIYSTLMIGGITYAPSVPPGLLSALSYVTGVLAVGGIDVAKEELKYARRKRRLRKAGFGVESYYESRFHVVNEHSPEEIIDLLADEFDLPQRSVSQYHDKYFQHALPAYNGRTAKVRLRQRERIDESDERLVKTAQIIYTRAAEQSRKQPDQCRYFPARKEKIYFMLDQEMPSTLEEIADPKARAAMQDAVGESAKTYEVAFSRSFARSKELAVCADRVEAERPFTIVELKVRRDTDLLIQAMRYLMVECDIAVEQTTHGKADILCA